MMYLKMAWRNIWRNRKRTWITASSIGFAVFFAVIMQSMQRGSYDRMIDNAVRFYTGHLSIHLEGYWDEQILDNGFDQTLLTQLNLVQEWLDVGVPRLTSFALASFLDKTKGVMVNGVDPEAESQLTYLHDKVVSGDYLGKSGVLIGEGLASYLKLEVGDTLVLISQGYHGVNAAGKFAVLGLLKFPVPELNQNAVYMDLKEAQYFYGAPNVITSYAMLLNDPDEMRLVEKCLREELTPLGLELMNWEAMMPELIQGIEMDYYGGLIMIYILYAIIGFGILGTFLMMSKERTYEFGVLVAIGMKKLKIQWMVTLEIILLSLLGVILGAIASLPLVIHFYFHPITFSGESAKAYESFGYEPIIPFALDPAIFYSQGMAILLISILLSIYPMLAIKQLKIHKALKE